MVEIVEWGDKRFDKRTAAMLTDVDKSTTIPIKVTQGSYNTSVSASAGTHSGGGAVDISTTLMTESTALKLVEILRKKGFAAYLRPRNRLWQRHIHAIAIQPGGKGDQGVLSGSAYKQVVEYYNQGDGLVGNLPDPHKNMGIKLVTWESTKRPAGLKPIVVPRYKDRGENVRLIQNALRAYVAKYKGWGRVKKINPSGATGYYGDETRRLVKEVYSMIAWETKNPGWLTLTTLTPGASLLKRLGFVKK